MDCSSGGNLPNIKYPVGPLYQVVLSDTVRKNVDMDTGAVGIITEPKDAEDILQKGKGDLVFIAREFLRDSAWVSLYCKRYDDGLNLAMIRYRSYLQLKNSTCTSNGLTNTIEPNVLYDTVC